VNTVPDTLHWQSFSVKPGTTAILAGLALATLVDMPQIKFIFAYPIKDTIL
jgi:hypothetical protein